MALMFLVFVECLHAVPATLLHCVATCPVGPMPDPRVVCLRGNHNACLTITYGDSVLPGSEWLDTIVRKAAHSCINWRHAGLRATKMRTCIRKARTETDTGQYFEDDPF